MFAEEDIGDLVEKAKAVMAIHPKSSIKYKQADKFLHEHYDEKIMKKLEDRKKEAARALLKSKKYRREGNLHLKLLTFSFMLVKLF